MLLKPAQNSITYKKKNRKKNCLFRELNLKTKNRTMLKLANSRFYFSAFKRKVFRLKSESAVKILSNFVCIEKWDITGYFFLDKKVPS